MAVHLTRIYTRTGDDGTTALGDMSRVPKTDPACRCAYADCGRDQRRDRRRPGAGCSCPSASKRSTAHDPERPVRRGRRPVHAGSALTLQYPAAAGRAGLRRSAWRAGAMTSTTSCPGCRASSCPGARRARHCCTRPGRVSRRAERSAWVLWESDPGAHESPGAALPQPALGPAVHPRLGSRTPRGTSSGSRAASGSGDASSSSWASRGAASRPSPVSWPVAWGGPSSEGDDLHPARQRGQDGRPAIR